jgi:hypothetical protein
MSKKPARRRRSLTTRTLPDAKPIHFDAAWNAVSGTCDESFGAASTLPQ